MYRKKTLHGFHLLLVARIIEERFDLLELRVGGLEVTSLTYQLIHLVFLLPVLLFLWYSSLMMAALQPKKNANRPLQMCAARSK